MNYEVMHLVQWKVQLVATVIHVTFCEKIVFDSVTSIGTFLVLVLTFFSANEIVKNEVARQRERNLRYLCMVVFDLAICVAFIYYIFDEMKLYYALVLMPTRSDMSWFWLVMWSIGVTDYVAKFGTVLVKIFVIALPGSILPFHRRGKYYAFIEHSSQLYRSLLPVYPWIFYIISSFERIFGNFVIGVYIVLKVYDSMELIKEWVKALQKLLTKDNYATNPTTEQLESAGTICPICHENYASPTRLPCTHIFCEECIAAWLDRQHTCPMCRAEVVDDLTCYRDGSTSHFIILF